MMERDLKYNLNRPIRISAITYGTAKLYSHHKFLFHLCESTTTRKEGGLDFTAIGGKRQGHEVPQSLRVEPGAKHPVWKTQLMG
jgi:hypothetical protein